MTLDKDDLLRNAAPGYVFITVVASFLVISDKTYVDASRFAVVGLFAGYPLGVIIQIVYRSLFHVSFGQHGEQAQMENDEAALMCSELKKIHQNGEIIDEAFFAQGSRKPSLLLSLVTKKYFDGHESRLGFLAGYVHFLGASILAIYGGLSLVWVISESKMINTKFPGVFLCFLFFWAFISLVLYLGRCRTKESYVLTLEMTVKAYKVQIKRFLKNMGVIMCGTGSSGSA